MPPRYLFLDRNNLHSKIHVFTLRLFCILNSVILYFLQKINWCESFIKKNGEFFIILNVSNWNFLFFLNNDRWFFVCVNYLDLYLKNMIFLIVSKFWRLMYTVPIGSVMFFKLLQITLIIWSTKQASHVEEQIIQSSLHLAMMENKI